MAYICECCDKNDKGTCSVYNDTSWVERRGGCPISFKHTVESTAKNRVGQQKQKHNDKTYANRKAKRRHYASGG